jgi:hypothetical protein
MKIEKQKILHDLKEDFRAAEIVKKMWDTQRIEWVNAYNGEPYGNEVEGRSKIVSKDIKKQMEWLLPSISDPFLNTSEIVKCKPVTFEDEASARQSELLLNTQLKRQFPWYNFINKGLRVLATEGTVVIQVGWDYEEEVVEEEIEVVAVDEYGMEYIDVEVQEVVKVLKNQPTAVVCRNEDIYVDPTCMDDFEKCQFIIHRYETDLSTLKSDGRYKNLDKLGNYETRGDTDYRPEDETRFNFTDSARKKMVVYEYWGNYDVNNDGVVEPIVCAWVGNTIIRLEDNPYPDGKPPFLVVPFNAVPFQLFGEAIAAHIDDNQKINTAIKRGIIDNMARSNNAQIGVARGALDMMNRKRFFQGKNFEYNGTPSSFWQGSYNQIPGSVFDMIALQNNEIESQTGVKSFSQGLNGNALANTATAARGVLDSTSMRTANLVRNIAENLVKPLVRKILAYNAEYLSDEEVIRITNDEFVTIRKDDLGGKIDIDIEIATQVENSTKSQQLAFLLQTLGNSVPFEMTQMVLAEIVHLAKMPQLEKQLREYKPQPDPAQEQLKQLEMERLQMEIERIKADIADKMARAGENEVDRVLKMRKAEVEAAKARKLGSEADMTDLKFLKDDNEYDRSIEDEREFRLMAHELELMRLQLASKNPNEQIGLPTRR